MALKIFCLILNVFLSYQSKKHQEINYKAIQLVFRLSKHDNVSEFSSKFKPCHPHGTAMPIYICFFSVFYLIVTNFLTANIIENVKLKKESDNHTCRNISKILVRMLVIVKGRQYLTEDEIIPWILYYLAKRILTVIRKSSRW